MEQIKQIDNNTILNLPKSLEFNNINGETLVLATDCGNCIVLLNDEQIQIFKNLQHCSVGETEKISDNKDDFNFVVAQILDRDFFDVPLKMSDEYDTVQIYLTNACNLACPHCYMSSGKANKNELSGEQWCLMIDKLKKHNMREIVFSGGEVLMHKDCLKIIKYAKSLGLVISLKTNGILWREEMVREISNCVDNVQISIDGISEEMNAKIRGVGNFEKALECVELFVKNGVKVTVATTPTYENLMEIESGFVDFAKDLVDKFGTNIRFLISQKMLGGRGVEMRFDKQAKEYAKITSAIMEQIYPNHKIKNSAINIERKERVRNCGYGNLTIASNGKIYLCNRPDELESFANVEDDFEIILQKAKQYNKMTSVENITPCKNCSVRYFCGGGCRIDEFDFKGLQSKATGELKKVCKSEVKLKIKQNLLNGLKYIYEK